MRTKIIYLMLLGGCAPIPQRVIEPARTIEPTAPAGAPNAEFVLSKENVRKPVRPNIYPVHIKEDWYPFRAKYLQSSVEEIKRRDQAIANVQPPKDFWDEQTAAEAVSVWTEFCNECHGGRRTLRDALGMPSPPAGWGTGEGLFFGKKKKYVDIYNTILDGGPPPEKEDLVEMPNWDDKLSKEMIWVLIYFLEYQSGGVEGRFPPSLYPRKPAILKE